MCINKRLLMLIALITISSQAFTKSENLDLPIGKYSDNSPFTVWQKGMMCEYQEDSPGKGKDSPGKGKVACHFKSEVNCYFNVAFVVKKNEDPENFNQSALYFFNHPYSGSYHAIGTFKNINKVFVSVDPDVAKCMVYKPKT